MTLLLAALALTLTLLGSAPPLSVLNPTGVYRLLNLAGPASAGTLTGMSGLAKSVSLGAPALVATLVLWMLGPLALAAAVFSRREL